MYRLILNKSNTIKISPLLFEFKIGDYIMKVLNENYF